MPFHQRYIVCILLFCAAMLAYALRVNFSVAIEPISCYYNISNYEQGLLLGSFFNGYFMGNMPAGYLVTKYGGKITLGYGIFIGSLITILMPHLLTLISFFNENDINNNEILNTNCICSDTIAKGWCFIDMSYTNECTGLMDVNICDHKYNFGLIYSLRIILGLFQSLCFPSFHSIIGIWANKQEKTQFTSFAFSGSSVGATLTLLISIHLMKSNWKLIFYIPGFIGLIWSYVWYNIMHDNPRNNTNITDKELKLLLNHNDSINTDVKRIPYINFITNKVSWSLFIVHSSHTWTLYFMLTMLPTYFHKQLHYDIHGSGITMVLPYICTFITPLIVSPYVDKLIMNGYNKAMIRKIMQTIANIVPGILLILCGYITNTNIIIILFSLAFGCAGLSNCGFFSNI